jgi:hypothetical protein
MSLEDLAKEAEKYGFTVPMTVCPACDGRGGWEHTQWLKHVEWDRCSCTSLGGTPPSEVPNYQPENLFTMIILEANRRGYAVILALNALSMQKLAIHGSEVVYSHVGTDAALAKAALTAFIEMRKKDAETPDSETAA